MGLTDREAYLDLRARCLRLLAALRATSPYNPETLAAFEQILQPEQTEPRLPQVVFPNLRDGDSKEQAHAA